MTARVVTTAAQVRDAIRTAEQTERDGLFKRVENVIAQMTATRASIAVAWVSTGTAQWIVDEVVAAYGPNGAGFQVTVETVPSDPRDGGADDRRITLML